MLTHSFPPPFYLYLTDVSGPPKSKLIMLDLFAEVYPIYTTTESFFGTPFVYSTVFNFGGRSGMYGRLDALAQGIADVVEGDNSVVGLGAAPEAIETSPVNYDLLFDHIFDQKKHNTDDWVKDYANRRYQSSNSQALDSLSSAWILFKRSVYNAGGSFK